MFSSSTIFDGPPAHHYARYHWPRKDALGLFAIAPR